MRFILGLCAILIATTYCKGQTYESTYTGGPNSWQASVCEDRMEGVYGQLKTFAVSAFVAALGSAGHNGGEQVADDVPTAVISELKRSKENNKKLADLNDRIRSQNQSIIIFSLVLLVLLATLVVSSLRTANLNKKLLQQKEALAQANVVKDKLFSIIGHDLKGTIGTIPPMLHLYHRENLSSDEKDFIFNSLYEHVNASKDTLEKLLLWGQSQIKGISITPGFVKVKSDSMQSIIAFLRTNAMEKGILIRENIPEQTAVFADQAHFEFVVRNMVSNAIKFSHRNSEVVIDAHHDAKDDQVVITVKDNGIGMSPERLQCIFELTGESTPGTDNEKGTSIGLMLCKEFAMKNNGRIWAESRLGEGTTFYFSLPAAHLPVMRPMATA